MKKDNKKTKEVLVINSNEFPIVILFTGKDGNKEYVLKTNTDQTKLLLNKKEY
jgi:hypothetical protein